MFGFDYETRFYSLSVRPPLRALAVFDIIWRFDNVVDGAEPFEPLTFITVTDIDHKFVVEYSVLFVVGEIMKSLFYTFAKFHREVSLNKFACYEKY